MNRLRQARGLAVTVGVVLFVAVWWLVPPLLYRHTQGSADGELKAITDTRTALLAGLLGIGALGTFWLNSRAYKISVLSLEASEQGQITERYAKAIEQLGSSVLDVRLGGIYSLERIACDSRRGQDQSTVVEVLSAFARLHGNVNYRGALPLAAAESMAAGLQGLFIDVQAAVTVLGRLPNWPATSRADLSGAFLGAAELRHANLHSARLERVDLHWANLQGADLSAADLRGADLSKADLRRASLALANLSGAMLINLAGPQLANLSGADLSGADLSGADLSRADLRGADLSGAKLDNAHLSGASLHGANLSGATGLQQHELDAAAGDGQTRLPADLRRPAWDSKS